MKFELKKMLLRSNTLIFVYCIILFFIGTLIYGTLQMKSASDLGEYLGAYNTQEELVKLAEENQASFEENKEDYENLGFDLEPLYERIKVFDYAIANHITQKSAVLFSLSLPFETKDSVGMMLTVNVIILICMLLSSSYLSVTMIDTDFSGKQSRFLYSANSRMGILKDKIKAFLLSACVIYLVLQLAGAILGRIFSTQINTVLFLVDGKVYGISYWIAELYEMLGGLVQLLPIVLLFFAFSVVTRQEEIAVILDIACFLLIFVVISDLGAEQENAILSSVGCNPFYQVAYGLSSVSEWMIAYAVEMALAVVLNVLGVLIFRKSKIR